MKQIISLFYMHKNISNLLLNLFDFINKPVKYLSAFIYNTEKDVDDAGIISILKEVYEP